MRGRTQELRVLVVAAILVSGCYESRSEGDGTDADGRDIREVDVLHDSVAEDAVDVPVACRPQETWEDPDIDCDMCNPCDPTPYIWQGDRCDYAPICCRCAGPDCDGLFVTLDECLDAHRDCPMASGAPPDYPGARLAWQAPGGFAGTGPVLGVDGEGMVRAWESDRGFYGLDDSEWARADFTYSENLGAEAANALFSLLLSVDYSDLPHPPGPFMECYPTLLFRTCATCEVVRLDYGSAADLLPEMRAVYDWFDERLCRGLGSWVLPSDYCVFDD